jgi:hypothetical protein
MNSATQKTEKEKSRTLFSFIWRNNFGPVILNDKIKT